MKLDVQQARGGTLVVRIVNRCAEFLVGFYRSTEWLKGPLQTATDQSRLFGKSARS